MNCPEKKLTKEELFIKNEYQIRKENHINKIAVTLYNYKKKGKLISTGFRQKITTYNKNGCETEKIEYFIQGDTLRGII